MTEKKRCPVQSTVIFPFSGRTIGGSHVSALALINYLIKNGVAASVVLHSHGILEQELRRRGIAFTVAEFPQGTSSKIKNLLTVVLSIPRIWRLFQMFRPDLVHTNDMATRLFWAFPCWIFRMPHVWHQRTKYSPSRLTRFLLRRATAVVSISNFVKSSLPMLKGAQIDRVIDNPIEQFNGETSAIPERIAIHSRMKTQCSLSELNIVGIFGSLNEIKNPLVAAESISQLNALLGGTVAGVFFGRDDGDWRERIKEVARTGGWESRAVFLDFTSPVEPWMIACDLLLACSAEDGFGRVLIEGMNVGTPVVAADSGGHREVILHRVNGLLASKGEPTEFALAMAEVLTDRKLRSDIIREGRNSARARFSIDRHGSDILELYGSIAVNPKKINGSQTDG